MLLEDDISQSVKQTTPPQKKKKKRTAFCLGYDTWLEINYKTGIASAHRGPEGIPKISMLLGITKQGFSADAV